MNKSIEKVETEKVIKILKNIKCYFEYENDLESLKFYSKSSILEATGFLENKMRYIVNYFSQKELSEEGQKYIFKNKTRLNSCKYSNLFDGLACIYGYLALEEMEKYLSRKNINFDSIMSTFDNYAGRRNNNAHVPSAVCQIIEPDELISDFNKMNDFLETIIDYFEPMVKIERKKSFTNNQIFLKTKKNRNTKNICIISKKNKII